MSKAILDVAPVKQAAQGRWYHICTALQISVPNNPRQHGSCPVCGGKDRFRFDDRAGSGSWFCNQCDPHAGDGIALVMRASRLPFREALFAVAGVLGIDHQVQTRPRRPLPPPPARIDRRAIAFTCELSALDRRLRAERIFSAARTDHEQMLTDEVRERLMAVVASAYRDLDQADRLECIADSLRLKDFRERSGSGNAGR